MKDTPDNSAWISYDEEADVVYVNFKRPVVAHGKDEMAGDVIARASGCEIIAYAILNASRRAEEHSQLAGCPASARR